MIGLPLKAGIRAGFETTVEPAELSSPNLAKPDRIMVGNGQAYLSDYGDRRDLGRGGGLLSF